jgi:hypothetical protein
MSVMIAALYVAAGGAYYNLPGVEPWGLPEKDARLYQGPHPVVAHPPCERWGRFAKAIQRDGGPVVGDDGLCFARALDAVRCYCGVLEHPAHSLAWEAYRLPKPYGIGWWKVNGEWVCYVEQGHYGHRARKATWLYYAGHNEPHDLIWGKSSPTPIPARSAASAIARGVLPSRVGAVAVMSRKQRQATPSAFRDALLALARGAR